MARRQVGGLFLMTPYALLRMPEYGRFFDGASIGYLYRLLLTGIRRQERKSLKFVNETGWVTKLAELYEQGKLASYFTLSDLSEATGFTERRISDLIKTLEKIKLVKTLDFHNGIIFILGVRLSQNEFDGYSVGSEHEGLFIDSWETAAQKNPDELAAFIVNELAPPKQKEKFLGKIFPDSTKNISEIEGPENEDFSRPEQKESSEEETASVNKVRINKNNADDLLFMFEDEPEVSEEQQIKNRLLSEPNWIEKIKVAREALKIGISLSLVNSLLADGLPEEFKVFSSYPRLGYRLYSLKYSEKESKRSNHVKLGDIWTALHEDVSGVNISSSEKTKEIRGFYKNVLLKKYSFNQVMWTFRNEVLTSSSTANFVSNGWRNLLSVVEQNSEKYHAIKKSRKEQEVSDTVQAERLKRIKDVREEDVNVDNIKNPWAKLYLSKENNEQ